MMNTNPLTPYILKNQFSSQDLQLSTGVFRVLETVLTNHKIPQTPTTKDEYILLLLKVNGDDSLRNQNISHILRTRADYFSKDSQLCEVIESFGFCFKRRIF